MLWEILDQPRQEILKKVVRVMPVPQSYLAGGTGLALLLGHRESIDFDWFTPVDFDPEVIHQALSNIGKVKISETKKGTFHGLVDNIQVTWLWYPNPLNEQLISSSDIPGFNIASVIDIGLMKWNAICNRGARKDFIDLYFICQEGIIMANLLDLLPKKFPGVDLNYYHLIKSLTYFEDAERELMPVMKKPIEWDDVKSYFQMIQKELLEKIKKDIWT